jgi:hypothetical protein
MHHRIRIIPLFPLLGLLLCLWAVRLPADIAIYGDTQGSDTIHKAVISGIMSHNPAIAFHVGDLTADGRSKRNWDSFFAIEKPLTDLCPIYPAKGNHDDPASIFTDHFPELKGRTYYSVEYDSLLFIVLDSTLDLMPRSEQLSWLREVLDSAGSLPKIVIMHRPIFSSGFHGGNEELALILPALFASRGVVAVFSGHDHNYERLAYGKVVYFVTGGGGGTQRKYFKPDPRSLAYRSEYHYLILDRQGKSLICRAYALDGALLDRTEILLP